MAVGSHFPRWLPNILWARYLWNRLVDCCLHAFVHMYVTSHWHYGPGDASWGFCVQNHSVLVLCGIEHVDSHTSVQDGCIQWFIEQMCTSLLCIP